jgi:hypothetical protein
MLAGASTQRIGSLAVGPHCRPGPALPEEGCQTACRKIITFRFNFSNACPEPVLVNRSLFSIKWRKNTFWHAQNSGCSLKWRRKKDVFPHPLVMCLTLLTEKNVLFGVLSLCLSRACLGKQIVFISKQLKKYVLLTEGEDTWLPGTCRKHASLFRNFSYVFLCLSRACLGKMIVFSI